MPYPNDCIFDMQTLIDSSQPESILIIANDSSICDAYQEQRKIINKPCSIKHFKYNDIPQLQKLKNRFDIVVVFDTIEHLDKQTAQQLLAQLRDIYAEKLCVALPISDTNAPNHWQQTDLFAFSMVKVNDYLATNEQQNIALYKYDLNNYKKTPNWLNPNNWANPELWNKFRW